MKRTDRPLVWMVLPLLLLTGCSSLSDLNPFADDEEEEKDLPTELTDFDEEVRVRELWSRGVGSGLGAKYIRMGPAFADSKLIAADAYGTVMAVDPVEGDAIWTVRIGTPDKTWSDTLRFWSRGDFGFVTGGVGAGDGIAVIGTADGEVVALDTVNGNEVWRVRVSSEVLAPPAVSNGIVAVQTGDGKLAGLDAGDGSRKWSYDTQVPILTLRGDGAPWAGDGVVVAPFANGRIAALRAATGEPLWDVRVAMPQGRSEIDRIVDVDGRPLVRGGVVYAASHHGHASAFRVADGSTQWEVELSTSQGLADGFGYVYAVTDEDDVVALDAATGTEVWRQGAFRFRRLGTPATVGAYVVVADFEGYLHVLTQADGRVVGRRRVDGDGVRSPMVMRDDVLYGLGNGGDLFAVQLEVR